MSDQIVEMTIDKLSHRFSGSLGCNDEGKGGLQDDPEAGWPDGAARGFPTLASCMTSWCSAPSAAGLGKQWGIRNQVLGSLRLEKHPEKTFIGRIERTFHFLGYHFSALGLTVLKETLK
jgi:hypothetical protein